MTISTEIDKGLQITLMCYLFIILIFRILAQLNIGQNIDEFISASFCCRLQAFFFKIIFPKKNVSGTLSECPDQKRRSVGLALGPNVISRR